MTNISINKLEKLFELTKRLNGFSCILSLTYFDIAFRSFYNSLPFLSLCDFYPQYHRLLHPYNPTWTYI